MRVVILNDPAAVARAGAAACVALVRRQPDAVLGLATGSTPIALYRELVAAHRRRELSLAGVTTFNLDEYVGLAPSDPRSYHSYVQQHLLGQVDIDPGRVHIPNGLAHPQTEAARYERAIGAIGGIDLQLLGIGRNGHIGFNEPTSSLASRTRVKTLAPQTLRDNSRHFDPGEWQPRLAITVGIGTILDAREILLVATGEAKADAVAAAVEGPVTAMVPASALQLHPRVTVLTDEAAATGLRLADYYRWVEQQRRELAAGDDRG